MESEFVGFERSTLVLKMMAVVLMVVAVVGCASVKEINVDWDEEADFSGFKTFAFSDEGMPFINEKAGVVVREMVAAELGTKGIRQVEAEEADFMVVLFPGQKHGMRVDWYSMGYMPWWGVWGGGIGVGARATDIKIGTMMVDIVDARLKRMVWRGTVDIEMKDDIKRSMDRVMGAIEKMFKNFPPR